MEVNNVENNTIVNNIETTEENTTRKLRLNSAVFNAVYAGFWIRLVAFIIDTTIIGALYRIIINPILAVSNVRTENMFFNFLFLAVYLGYFVLMTKFTNGQTLGKIIMNLRVVSLKEDFLSWETVLIRELCGRYIQKVIMVLYLITPFNTKKQHFADYLSDTVVIKEDLIDLYQYEKERSAI